MPRENASCGGGVSSNLAPIIPLSPRKKEKRPYRKTQYALVDRKDWNRDFDPIRLMLLIARLRSQSECTGSEHFRAGCSGPSSRERTILNVICLTHSLNREERVTLSRISDLTNIPLSHVSPIVRRLADSLLIINIGTKRAVSLAVNPQIGYWDLGRLKKDRSEASPGQKYRG